jgi:hypothetical protein
LEDIPSKSDLSKEEVRAMPKTIEAFKLRTELIVDGAKGHTEYKKLENDQKSYGKSAEDAAKKADSAWGAFFKGVSKGQEKFQGAKFGKKFGEDFGASAVSAIGGTFSVSTLGGLIGTAIAPGIGTAVGSAIGGGIDSALSKVTPLVMEQISGGIALNKLLEETAFEFKTFAGSEKEANKYLTELLDISTQVGILPQILIDASEKTFDLTGNLKLTRSILKAATDQAADFGGSVEVFQKVAEVLGLIAEKGELTNKELRTMFKLGIDAKKYLLEGTGLQEKQLERLMAAGRIRGDVAARLIAEGIERNKGGFAAARTGATVAGRERQFNSLMARRAMEGTKNITRGIGDFYEQADAILNSPQAQKVVGFIDKYAGTLLDFTEKSLKVGVSVGAGVAEGILNFNPSTMMQSFTKLGGFVETGLKSVFEINSPSERTAREIGIPMGEGLGAGMVTGFSSFMDREGADAIMNGLKRHFLNPQSQSKANLQNLIAREPDFLPKLIAGAQSRGLNPDHLLNVMAVETSGTFNPAIKNPTSSASGLIQFMANTAKSLGTSTAALRAMTATHQLDYVFKYFDQSIKKYGPLDTQGKVYAAVGAGKVGRTDESIVMRRGDRGYEGNKATWDRNLDGLITQGEMGVAALNKLGAGISFSINGGAVTAANPMPVAVVQDISGGASSLLRQDSDSRANSGVGNRFLQRAIGQQQVEDLTATIDLADDEIVNITTDFGKLTQIVGPGISDFNQLIGSTSVALHAMRPLIAMEEFHADSSIALTKKYQEAARQELIKGISIVDQITGALGQVAGMIPSQQVGKKRGLFSKILGIAAPFLAFIPGVGPILSTIAGAASNIAGGNYGAAVSSIAGGFQTGGVFRSSSSGPKTSGSPGVQGRAFGGAVYRNTPYVVGERRPELFVPNRDGYIHPNAAAAMRGAGGGAHPELASAVDRLHTLLSRLESMPAHEIVRMGANGLTRAMDSDAGLANRMGRRLNFG